MGIIDYIMLTLLLLLPLAVLAFAAGPYVLRWFFNTLDEWLEIIDSAKDEK